MGCLSAWMQGRSGSRRKSAWQACGAVNLLAGSLLWGSVAGRLATMGDVPC